MNLEKTYIIISNWLSLLVNTFVSIIKVLIRSKFNATLPNLSNSKCVILGNGPSLTQTLEKYGEILKEPTTTLFCVNHFASSNNYEQLRPTFYVMLDPGFFTDTPSVVVNKTLDQLRLKTSWKLYLLIPSYAQNKGVWRQQLLANQNVEIYHFNYIVFKGFDKIASFFYRKNWAAPQCQNVMVASLFLAVNCGFKKIFLVGGDHNWHNSLHVNENNELCIKDIHFYDEQESVKYVLLYKPSTKDLFKVHEIFDAYRKAFIGYQAIQVYAKSCKASIYNASEVSFIDAFERKKLSE